MPLPRRPRLCDGPLCSSVPGSDATRWSHVYPCSIRLTQDNDARTRSPAHATGSPGAHPGPPAFADRSAPDTTQAHADANMTAFREDLDAHRVGVRACDRSPAGDGQGRYAYRLTLADGTCLTVTMPGLPLARVRWVGAPGQDIRAFPHLRVNNASGVWGWALEAVKDHDYY